jgi:hypothetical protein
LRERKTTDLKQQSVPVNSYGSLRERRGVVVPPDFYGGGFVVGDGQFCNVIVRVLVESK